jgi:transcriptional regulator with PAS, ATPase and Fis domain
VRELENAVEHAVVMTAADHEVDVAALPSTIMTVLPAGAVPARPAIPGASLAELERYAILRTLEACGGSTSRAAQALGISARTIQYRLHAYCNAPRSGVEALHSGRARAS